jgi:hypothetical protein
MKTVKEDPISDEKGEPGLLATLMPLIVALCNAYLNKSSHDRENERNKDDKLNRRPDWMVIFTAASAAAALLAAMFAGWAAYENQASVRETNRATRASVWLQVLAEYETADMLKSINSLREWQSKTPAFDKRFYELLTTKNLTGSDLDTKTNIDADRRRVIKFFDKLRILTQGEIIDSYFVSQNWDSGTYTYINDVLAPLHRQKLQAMLDTKAITQKDFENSSKVLADIEAFYYSTAVLKREYPASTPPGH